MKSLKVKRIKRRHFSNKKTYRNKKRGGMHKSNTSPLPPHKQQEIASVHAALLPPGVSPGLRAFLLTTGDSGIAAHLSDRLLHNPHNPHFTRGLHLNGRDVLYAAEPYNIPSLIKADIMFQQAEQLCSKLRELPDAEMWNRGWSGAMTCTPRAKEMCVQAVSLYKGAIQRKYLPAYAPLAWMMSHADPDESLSLCEECIAACNTRTAFAARKAKTDCVALRAFVQYQQDELMHDEEIEMATPGTWSHREVPAMKAPPIEQLHKIAKESIAEGSKYGYALEWLLLSHDFEVTRDEAGILRALKNAEKKEDGKDGLDFQRCRFCVMP